MLPAIHLNKEETKKISDKSSMAYKALIKMLRELRQRTGLKVSVIGTDNHGELYEIDVHDE